MGHEAGCDDDIQSTHQDGEYSRTSLPCSFSKQDDIQYDGQPPQQIQPGDITYESRCEYGCEGPLTIVVVIGSHPVEVEIEDDKRNQDEHNLSDQLATFYLIGFADGF